MEQFIESLPLMLAAVVPPVIAAIRRWAGQKIPSHWIPVILPVAGGILGALGNAVGVNVDVSHGDPTMWEQAVIGVLIGSASVGLHQIKKQRDKASQEGV